METRRMSYAGTWYPDSADECIREIESFLAEKQIDSPVAEPCGAIVPHAGWVFSGGIACRAISLLKNGPEPDTIILFGMHLYPKSAPRIMPGGSMATPLGPLEINRELAEKLVARFSFGRESDIHFTPDNSIEVQLPFIKYFFKNAQLVAMGVPPDPVSVEIGKFVARTAREMNMTIRVIGSTDLTHYGTSFGLTHYGLGEQAYRQVRENEDRWIIERMLEMEPYRVIDEALAKHNACCAGAAAAALAAGKELGSTGACLTEYATSYDKSPTDSFVGYAGIVF
ncbi:MAG: AmmeMemoRadiSam system protein B [Desulfococcus sp. 4484_241]|nr:MAG: AmmeMemoRadiSam system protein B [Desulfococcus sp. 4484_241]